MTWFSNLAIRKKLAVGFGALVVVVALLGLFALHQIAKVNSATEEIATRRLFSIRYLTGIQSDINVARRTELTWMLVTSKDEAARYDAKFNVALQKLQEDIKAGKARYESIASDQERQAYQRFETTMQACVAEHEQVFALRQQGKEAEAHAAVINLQAGIQRMFDALDEAVAVSHRTADAAAQEAAAEYAKTRFSVILLLVISIAVGILLTVTVSRSIGRPLQRVVAMLRDIAEGEGDLTKPLAITSQDELGELAKWFNVFLDKLHTVISQVAGTAERVTSATEEISANATVVALGGETQKDQVHQVATAMQEMSATVHEVSENCTKAAESARKASQTAREGGVIVDDTLTLMRSIAGSVRETAKSVQELGSRSDQIGKIVGVIDDIADQTNLLALNAAIEAARAGEQGRGFAVVADEVRKLAERTTKATKEIAEMIQSVQAETRGAVDKMQSGTRTVEKGVEVNAKAGASLQQIISQAEHVGEMVTHIATAAKEQSSATEQVNSNMDQISKLVAESAEGAQQSAKACEQLSGLAFELQNLVSRFKLGDQAGRAAAAGYRSPRQVPADPSRVRTALALAPKPQEVYQPMGHDRDGE